jgi:hypothetical protein
LEEQRERFLQIVLGYAVLNPHATFRVEWNSESIEHHPAIDPAWTKGGPSDPTSPHWYDPARFERLAAAYAREHGDRTVREFVTEFRGLKGSAKVAEVLEASGLGRVALGELFDGGRPTPNIRRLLREMQSRSNPVKPADLGIIGRENFARRFRLLGAGHASVDRASSFEYKLVRHIHNGIPTVIEAAFAYRPGDRDGRMLFTGVNWSPAILNPFRQLGRNGESLERVLAGQYAESGDPIIVAVHLASPIVSYLDRGKSAIALRGGDTPKQDGPDEEDDSYQAEVIDYDDGSLASAMVGAVKAVTKRWHRQRLSEVKGISRWHQRRQAMERSRKVSLKVAAWDAMEEGYQKASAGADGRTLPANARQIMYALRKQVQERSEKQLDGAYFSQSLLPDYLAERKPAWAENVVYDDRGTFTEPHTGHTFGLGTLNVRKYLDGNGVPAFTDGYGASVRTSGPAGRFGGLFFIEKEGFDELIEAVQLAERYDLAFMSTKGISVTAARLLADQLCHKYRIPLFLLRDCDKAGFSGAATFKQDNRRYAYKNKIKVVDLGLRLADVRELGIEDLAEDIYDRGSEDARRANLLANGATEEEAEFLLTKRVELNALTSGQLVEFIERKLQANGVRKIVPKAPELADAYRLFKRASRITKMVEAEQAKPRRVTVPTDLEKRVRAHLKKYPEVPWDAAVRHIAKN